MLIVRYHRFGKKYHRFGKNGPPGTTALVKMAFNLLEYQRVFSFKDILKIYLRGENALPSRAGVSPFGNPKTEQHQGGFSHEL
jgi:hypothetical protein